MSRETKSKMSRIKVNLSHMQTKTLMNALWGSSLIHLTVIKVHIPHKWVSAVGLSEVNVISFGFISGLCDL